MKLPLMTILIGILIMNNSALISDQIRHYIKNHFIPVSNKHEKIFWTKQKSQPQDLPNIILIIADDLGFNDVINSPNIKSIYQNGIKFNNAYAGHATCAPSRASIYTGRFPTKLGLEFTPHPPSLDVLMHFQRGIIHNNIINISNMATNPPMKSMSLNKNETLISNVLHKNNYTNYFLGKWHLGEKDGYRPRERGFDESLSFLYGASMYGDEDDPNIISVNFNRSLYSSYISKWIPFGISHNNGKMFKPNKYMTDYLSDSAIDVIRSERNSPNPFFITLAYNAPHNPYQSLKSDYDNETGHHHEKVYKAMIKAIDRGVGNIIQSLKDENKYDNTLIIFTSDNGGTHLIGIDDVNFPYNGWKCTFFEGGIKVPMFWQWPKKIPKNIEFNKTVSHVDIFSTITSFVNYVGKFDDGQNLMPYILDNIDGEPHDTLFWRSGDYRSVKQNDWKLSTSDKINKSWFFNLKDDPSEKNNLIMYTNQNNTIGHKYDELNNKMTEINKNQHDSLWRSPIMMAIPIYGTNITSDHDEYVYWSV